MTFTANRVKKYIEAVQKRLKATDKEVGRDYVNFINENNKTIIGFYFEIDNNVYTLTDLYYNNDFYPLVKNKAFSLKAMMKAVNRAERKRCMQENMAVSFEEYENSLG